MISLLGKVLRNTKRIVVTLFLLFILRKTHDYGFYLRRRDRNTGLLQFSKLLLFRRKGMKFVSRTTDTSWFPYLDILSSTLLTRRVETPPFVSLPDTPPRTVGPRLETQGGAKRLVKRTTYVPLSAEEPSLPSLLNLDPWSDEDGSFLRRWEEGWFVVDEASQGLSVKTSLVNSYPCFTFTV